MNASQPVYRMSIASSPKNIGKVENFLKKVNHAVHLDEIQMHKLMVSLTEAVNNAIVHGNKSDEKKKVAIVCEILPGWLLFLVTDEGSGFNAEKIKNPLSKRNLMKESGRGIFLMRTLMDKVEFEPIKKGMQVRLWLDTGKG
ncbi:MAG TPA: ATP-binding protein [Bacteroidota bacterium]|nr:ATP-binding protein [Bacteroidota bacterium]